MAARGRFQRARPVACRGASGRPPPAGCLPYLPRLGLGIVSRASVPQGSISTPTHAVSAPHAPTISLSFSPFGQYPGAHRPSVPRWLAGGSRAVSTPACVAGPSLVQPPTRASASNVQASEPRASARRPSPSAGTRVPSPGCPHHRPPAAFTASRARAPDERPPPRRRVRPRPIPTQARASATGGFEHRPTSRARSGEARWRRSEDLLTNRLAAARARSWRRWRRGNPCPAAGPFRPWDILERRRDQTRGTLPATRPTAMQRVSTRASVATRVAQSGRNFGCASERYVSERPQCGEQDMTRAVGPATGRVTTCHGDHGRHGAGHVQRRVTAPGHGGHGAGHRDHGDGERPAGPESTAAPAAGAAAFTIPFQGLEVEETQMQTLPSRHPAASCSANI